MNRLTFADACAIATDVFSIPDNGSASNLAGYLVWNHTGWPCFWHTDDAATEIRKSLEDWRDGKVDEDGYPIEVES